MTRLRSAVQGIALVCLLCRMQPLQIAVPDAVALCAGVAASNLSRQSHNLLLSLALLSAPSPKQQRFAASSLRVGFVPRL
jgi:hypothetical protein